jgi:hypothetical protein
LAAIILMLDVHNQRVVERIAVIAAITVNRDGNEASVERGGRCAAHTVKRWPRRGRLEDQHGRQSP